MENIEDFFFFYKKMTPGDKQKEKSASQWVSEL